MQTYTLDSIGDYIIFSDEKPYTDVLKIYGYKDVLTGTGSLLREFRWSVDGKAFSEWILMTPDTLVKSIPQAHYPKFYIEFRYELKDANPVTISSISLDLKIDTAKCSSEHMPFNMINSREYGNRLNPIKDRPFTWKPYDQNNAIKLHQDLSYIVNDIYGHEVSYFKTIPDGKGTDVIFAEHTLYNRQPAKCLKVLVPDNAFPDSQFNFNQFGIDFEMPFEVHVDKRMFESIFGFASMPQKLDCIYFPINDRMYDVQSTTLVRDFMQRPIYWKISLIKHQNEAAILQTQDIKDQMDNITTGIQEMLGPEIEKEKQDNAAIQQLDNKSNQQDNIREFLDYRINSFILQENITNSQTTISQYHYNLSINYDKELRGTAVRYRAMDTITDKDDRVFTAWFKENDFAIYKRPVQSVVVNSNIIKLYFQKIPNVIVNDYMRVYTAEKGLSFFGKVKEISTNNLPGNTPFVVIEVDPYILSIANNIYPDWSNLKSLVGMKSGHRVLIWNHNDYTNKGYLCEIFDSQYINVKLNGLNNWFILANPLQRKWYSIVLNMSNTFGQLGLYLYERANEAARTTKLVQIYKNILNLVPAEDRTSGIKMELINSPIKITNVRILKKPLEEEEHSLFLNKNVMTDSSSVILADNAIPRYVMTKIGNPK